ncbi:hypothetical protein MAUB_36780 [Mycolicibacterium aubagnense]|uniref:Uncharacterized protein n=1 Tax=Mycolicibacterium aubagnense TaxID=319707 RepID=A0ABN5YVG9_9MYCO|nr:hypothetical protein MAUB_36780 [Mycolicibacterium aubagnense]
MHRSVMACGFTTLATLARKFSIFLALLPMNPQFNVSLASDAGPSASYVPRHVADATSTGHVQEAVLEKLFTRTSVSALCRVPLSSTKYLNRLRVLSRLRYCPINIADIEVYDPPETSVCAKTATGQQVSKPATDGHLRAVKRA